VLTGPDRGLDVTAGEDGPISIGTDASNTLVLTDRAVSRFHVELTPTSGGFRVIDLGSTNGVRVGGVRLHRGIAESGARLELGGTVVEVVDAGVASAAIAVGIAHGIVAETVPMRLLLARTERAAATELPVLVTGESGSGKERIAHALHALSARRDGPLEILDCAATPETLLASALFGHERGAFTGAGERRIGAIERAEGGTLFLDEIGELDLAAQSALLGVLSRRVFRRVGGDQEIRADVRIVAATHRDLREAVNQGRLRPELFHRLASVVLRVPALRERKDDIPALARHFLRLEQRSETLDEAALATWMEHDWPGNVRELRNAVLASGLGEALDPVRASASQPFGDLLDAPYRDAREAALARFETSYLRALLASARENVAEAARRADVDRTHLHVLLKKRGLR
jgi:DNA-binding NtrC family response regulator